MQGIEHICPVYDFIKSNLAGGSHAIVMKKLGKSLEEIMKEKHTDDFWANLAVF